MHKLTLSFLEAADHVHLAGPGPTMACGGSPGGVPAGVAVRCVYPHCQDQR